jgi:hypothetical protein
LSIKEELMENILGRACQAARYEAPDTGYSPTVQGRKVIVKGIVP